MNNINRYNQDNSHIRRHCRCGRSTSHPMVSMCKLCYDKFKFERYQNHSQYSNYCRCGNLTSRQGVSMCSLCYDKYNLERYHKDDQQKNTNSFCPKNTIPICCIKPVIDNIFQFCGIQFVYKICCLVCKDWSILSQNPVTEHELFQRCIKINDKQLVTSELKTDFEALSQGTKFIRTGAKDFRYFTKDGSYSSLKGSEIYSIHLENFQNIKYFGEVNDGKANGIGKMFGVIPTYGNKYITYESIGKFENNMFNGFGYDKKMEFSVPFDTYIGYFKNGKHDGFGKQEKLKPLSDNEPQMVPYEIYNGHFKNGERDGSGNLKEISYGCLRDTRYSYTNTYIGHFKNGKRDGLGIQEDEGKIETYSGEFKEGYKHGKGLFKNRYHNSGTVSSEKRPYVKPYSIYLGGLYEMDGIWNNNIFSKGQIIITNNKGVEDFRYIGEYIPVNSTIHPTGKGEYKLPNGTIYHCLWIDLFTFVNGTNVRVVLLYYQNVV